MYIGQDTKNFKQNMSTGIDVGGRLVFIPLLVDDNVDVIFEVPGMNEVVAKFKQQEIRFADKTFNEERNEELFRVDMLLGIDILQFFPEVRFTKIYGGTCLIVNSKFAPVGNVLNFLNDVQKRQLFNTMSHQVRNENLDPKTKSNVNLVMDPLKSFFNPLDSILSESDIDNGLENLFSLESMGIKNIDEELVPFDKEQIDKFREGISFVDGHYNVELPWYPDKIHLVPSNHFVALKVLDRTMEHLGKKGLISKYEEVFDKQLEDGIIEEISVKPSDYNNYTWIPHRPVIEMDEQVTTKIRPVFNCSLKTNKELSSLNEVAYLGIDLCVLF